LKKATPKTSSPIGSVALRQRGGQIKPGSGEKRHVQRHTWKIHKLIPISVDLPITQRHAWALGRARVTATGADSKKFLRRVFQEAASFFL
jgi:hypothetical protein